MTLQEIFDKIATHLLKQGAKSKNTEGRCMYRGPDGLMCAAGCLIDDVHYRDTMEGRSVVDRLIETAIKSSIGAVPPAGCGLLLKLQEAHDGRSPEEWRSALRKIAADFKLNADALK